MFIYRMPIMQSYQYTRPRLCYNSSDSYNPFHATGTPTAHEYGTNGRTTSVMSGNAATSDASSVSITTVQIHDIPMPSPSLNDSVGGDRRVVSLRNGTRTSLAEKPESNVVRNSILAGSISGIVSTIVLYPMDVIRTKMQTAGNTSHHHHHRGPIQVVRHTIQHGGVRALYTGMTLPLAAQAVYKGTVFSVFNVTQQFIVDWKTFENRKTGNAATPGKLTMLDRFSCGFVAGAVNGALFVTPVEFVRNQVRTCCLPQFRPAVETGYLSRRSLTFAHLSSLVYSM
jgi:Mitochondrial carrier protein